MLSMVSRNLVLRVARVMSQPRSLQAKRVGAREPDAPTTARNAVDELPYLVHDSHSAARAAATSRRTARPIGVITGSPFLLW